MKANIKMLIECMTVRFLHNNEALKRLYQRIGHTPNFGPIFLGKKCGLSTGKYGTSERDFVGDWSICGAVRSLR